MLLPKFCFVFFFNSNFLVGVNTVIDVVFLFFYILIFYFLKYNIILLKIVLWEKYFGQFNCLSIKFCYENTILRIGILLCKHNFLLLGFGFLWEYFKPLLYLILLLVKISPLLLKKLIFKLIWVNEHPRKQTWPPKKKKLEHLK